MSFWKQVAFALAPIAVIAGMVTVLAAAMSRPASIEPEFQMQVVDDEASGPPLAPASRYPTVWFTPDARIAMEPGRDVVYTPTFRLAWWRMSRRLVYEGGVIPVEPRGAARGAAGDPPLVADVAGLLNDPRFVFRPGQAPRGAWFAEAGAVEDGVGQVIKDRLSRQFPWASMHVPEADEPDAFYAYAYVQRRPVFDVALESLRLEMRLGAGPETVEAFGVGPQAPAAPSAVRNQRVEQIRLIDYFGRDNFILELTPRGDVDRIVLAKVAPRATLAETINQVQARIAQNSQGRRLRTNDLFAAPVVSLDVEASIDALVGRRVRHANGSVYRLAEARQGVRLRLDERGGAPSPTWDGPPSPPPGEGAAPGVRQLLLNRPFLLMLSKARGTQPYFAAWLETDAMVVAAPTR